MISDAPFLAAIAEQPDEDAPRLVFADWLDEHGDADRAEFIRVQCALERVSLDHPNRPDLLARERDLLARRRAEWEEPLRGIVRQCGFRRGFLEVAVLTGRNFLDRGAELFQRAPVRSVRLALGRGEAVALAVSPLLKHLSALDLSHMPIGDDGANALAKSPHLVKLRSLILEGCSLGPAGVRSLAGSRSLAGLAELDLTKNKIGLEGVQALGGPFALPGLTRLALGGIDKTNVSDDYFPLRRDDLDEMWRLPVWRRLRGLRLRLAGREERCLRRLASSPLLRVVTELDLHHSHLDHAGLATLIGSRHLLSLRELNLSFTELGGKGARVLCESGLPETLEVLNLSHNNLSDGGAAVLAGSEFFGRLVSLDLSMNRIGCAGAAALAERSAPTRLTKLDLIYNSIPPAGRDALRARYGENVCLFEHHAHDDLRTPAAERGESTS